MSHSKCYSLLQLLVAHTGWQAIGSLAHLLRGTRTDRHWDYRKIFIGSSIIRRTITLSPQSPPGYARSHIIYCCLLHCTISPSLLLPHSLCLLLDTVSCPSCLQHTTEINFLDIYCCVNEHRLANVFRSTMIIAKLRRNYFCKWSLADCWMAYKCT